MFSNWKAQNKWFCNNLVDRLFQIPFQQDFQPPIRRGTDSFCKEKNTFIDVLMQHSDSPAGGKGGRMTYCD